MSPNLASNLSVMRLLYAVGLLILAVPAWRKGWRRSVVAVVLTGIAASLGLQLLPALSGDPHVIPTAPVAMGLIELASLAVRWLSMLVLVSLACSRRADPEVNAGKEF